MRTMTGEKSMLEANVGEDIGRVGGCDWERKNETGEASYQRFSWLCRTKRNTRTIRARIKDQIRRERSHLDHLWWLHIRNPSRAQIQMSISWSDIVGVVDEWFRGSRGVMDEAVSSTKVSWMAISSWGRSSSSSSAYKFLHRNLASGIKIRSWG